MTQRQPIDVVTGLDRTRRSMGDGTVRGRARIATPYDPRRLKRPGAVVTPRMGAATSGQAIGLVAVQDVPNGGAEIEWAEPILPITTGFTSAFNALPATELPAPVTGVTQLVLEFEWLAVDHDSDWTGEDAYVEVRRDGEAIWRWDAPDSGGLPVPRFAAASCKVPIFRGSLLSVFVGQASGVAQTIDVRASWGLEDPQARVTTDAPVTCWTDFSEYPVGLLTANDWVTGFRSGTTDEWEVVEAAGTTGGKMARFDNPTATDGEAAVWDCVPDVSGGEVVGRFRVIDTRQRFVGPILRARTDAEGGGRGYHAPLGSLGLSFRLVRLDGTDEVVLADSGLSQENDTWYWIRFRIEGSLLRAKIWQDGTAEPSGWTLETIDDTYASGRAGILGTFAPVFGGALRDCDVFSFTIPGTASMTDPEL